MDNPIMITPSDLVKIILFVAGAIITLSGAGMVIMNIAKKIKQPETTQNERIEELEQEVHSIHERLKLGNVRFQSDMERMDKMEKSFKEINIVIIEGLQALTAHAIDGNNTEALAKSKTNLDTYLREHIGGSL